MTEPYMDMAERNNSLKSPQRVVIGCFKIYMYLTWPFIHCHSHSVAFSLSSLNNQPCVHRIHDLSSTRTFYSSRKICLGSRSFTETVMWNILLLLIDEGVGEQISLLKNRIINFFPTLLGFFINFFCSPNKKLASLN